VADLLWLPGKLADNDYFFAEPKTFTWKSGKLTQKNRLSLNRHRLENVSPVRTYLLPVTQLLMTMGHLGLLANHEQNPNLIDLNGVVFN